MLTALKIVEIFFQGHAFVKMPKGEYTLIRNVASETFINPQTFQQAKKCPVCLCVCCLFCMKWSETNKPELELT